MATKLPVYPTMTYNTRCQRTVFIPANPDYASLNLAAACIAGVVLQALRMAAYGDRPTEMTRTVPFSSPLASDEDIERYYAHLERIMINTRFLDPQQPKRLIVYELMTAMS